MRVIIVSGLSGSGKSIALQTLEDLQHYCVDNLPMALLKPFAEALLVRQRNGRHPITAVGIDARNFTEELAGFPELIRELRDAGLQVETLFLQASDETLLKRYSETRRKHPLSLEGVSLQEAIQAERRLLDPIQAQADLIIDTSHTTVHELRDLVRSRLHDAPPGVMSILFESFGFKNGVPADADFVFDVRCLPNPYWVPELRGLTGQDPPVASFLTEQGEVGRMIDAIGGFLRSWIPAFETGSRSYLTIAVGCTGGQHRSVFVVDTLGRQFGDSRRNVLVRHRELVRRA